MSPIIEVGHIKCRAPTLLPLDPLICKSPTSFLTKFVLSNDTSDCHPQATKDIDVQLVFNNAGFITPGIFHAIPLARNLGNYECNATCTIKITHHFLNKITEKGLRGYIGFTSSSAGFVPNPLSAMYASTKAFLTMFASSVAAEVKSMGVDVVVVHPSPVASNFFDKGTSLGALMAFKKFAAGPEVIADVLFSSAGRCVVRDQGAVTIIFRIILKIIDGNFFSELTARFAHWSGDHAKFSAKLVRKD